MANRKNISSGSPFEQTFGFSRAVKLGNRVYVSGSTSIQPDGSVAGIGDAYAQTMQAIRTIEEALNQAGAKLEDVVRTRVYTTGMEHLDAIGRAHGEVFGAIRPAATLVEITGLVLPEMLVEVEADAVISDG